MSRGRVAARLAGGLLLIAALATAGPAAAFWPLTRSTPTAPADSLTPERLQARFEAWKTRPAAPDGAAPGPAASPASGPGGQRIRYDSRTAASGTTAPADTAAAAPSAAPASPPDTATATGAAAAPTDAAPAAGADETFAGDTADPFAADRADEDAPADSAGSGLSMADLVKKAQQSSGTKAGGAPPDSGFTPTLRASLSSTNDKMNFDSNMNASFVDRSGVRLTAGISFAEDVSLTQGVDTQIKALTNSIDLPLQAHGLSLSLGTTNRKRDTVGRRTVSGALADNSSDDRGAQVTAKLSRQLADLPGAGRFQPVVRGVGFNTFYSRNFAQNDQNVVASLGGDSGDRSHDGTGSSYGFGVSFDRVKWMTVRARYGRSTVGNRDRAASFVRPDNPDGEEESNSGGDTTSVDVTVPTGWGVFPNLRVAFQVTEGADTYTDNASSSSGGSSGGIGNFVLETHDSYNRSIKVSVQPKPMRVLQRVLPWGAVGSTFGWLDQRTTFKLDADAGRSTHSYVVRKNLFSDTERLGWKLESTLKYARENRLVVNVEASRNDIDQDEARSNPQNPTTRLDESRRLAGDLFHDFTSSFKVHAYGDIQLQQSFHAHAGSSGRLDNDVLRTRLGIEVSGRMGSKATGQVTAYVRTLDQAYIDRARSATSKDETEYVVRPSFTYTINSRMSVSQRYGLSSKVVDKRFDLFDPIGDTLNRNHFMNTSFTCAMTPRLTVDVSYDYVLQDNGKYLTGADRVRRFSPEARTKKDAIGMGINYKVLRNDKLNFVSRQEASRDRFAFPVGSPPTITNRGNLALGLESKLKIGQLNLDCRLRRNQSFNVSLNRKVYFNADATLSYTF